MADESILPEPRYVGFWKRFLAFLVDSLVVTIVLSPLMLALYGGGYFAKLNAELAALLVSSGDPNADVARVIEILGRPDSALSALGDIRVQLGLLVATVLFWRFRGATPGKMLVKARIVTADGLVQASTARLIGRFLAYFVSIFGFCLGFLWIAFDKRKQGWHDKLAGTVVIEERN
ncbi:MAG TPA: RDD family protein [Burkholderiales bacterium]|nr:RDD family protein [Burkholderiales bacterium]